MSIILSPKGYVLIWECMQSATCCIHHAWSKDLSKAISPQNLKTMSILYSYNYHCYNIYNIILKLKQCVQN